MFFFYIWMGNQTRFIFLAVEAAGNISYLPTNMNLGFELLAVPDWVAAVLLPCLPTTLYEATEKKGGEEVTTYIYMFYVFIMQNSHVCMRRCRYIISAPNSILFIFAPTH